MPVEAKNSNFEQNLGLATPNIILVDFIKEPQLEFSEKPQFP